VREFLPLTWVAFVMPPWLPRRYRIDWMRPPITKSTLRGGFLGDEFVGRFNNSAQWISQLVGVFSVGVVNSPESLDRLPCAITRNILTNIELRRCRATDKHHCFIAKALGVTIHELFQP
jgi:hypothetical protein